METRDCRNCGRPFTRTAEHIHYCTGICRSAAHRKRIRIKRTQRNTLATELALRSQATATHKCLHCKKPISEFYDGVFCSEDCWITYWTARLSRGGTRKPLTAEQIVYHEHYSPIIR